MWRQFTAMRLYSNAIVKSLETVFPLPLAVTSRLERQLHRQPDHPICQLSTRVHQIIKHSQNPLPVQLYDQLQPIVSVTDNFDRLLFPKDHPGRSKSDTFYVDDSHVLRTHTSAHQASLLADTVSLGKDVCFLIVGDVYRRDQVDATHSPVFHQCEGVRTFTRDALDSLAEQLQNDETCKEAALSYLEERRLNPGQPIVQYETEHRENESYQSSHWAPAALLVEAHLKWTLSHLIRSLFHDLQDKALDLRWTDTTFPFTSPSFELEIAWQNQWLEVFGCGIMRQEILDNSRISTPAQARIGWAFGLGLERLAMVRHAIPDIRLFWTMDSRFCSQFALPEGVAAPWPGASPPVQYQAWSKYPSVTRDLSIWVTKDSPFHYHDICQRVQEICSELVEKMEIVDTFEQSHRTSFCYRITYQSMEKTLLATEVNLLHDRLRSSIIENGWTGVTLR